MGKIKDDLLSAVMSDSNRFKSTSLEDSVDKRRLDIIDAASKSKPINDSYRNDLSSIGTADMVQSFNSYGFNNDTLNWPLWLALYNDSWVFRRAIDKPSQDSINAGITLIGEGNFNKVYKDYNKYKFDLIKILQWGALFGGSVGVMLFDTIPDKDMIKPLDKSKIKGAKMKMYVTDRWYGVSVDMTKTVTNMRDIDFGKPEMYNITFANGKSFPVHHSYVLRYEHRTAPNLVKNGQLQGWGYAEGAHILNELSRDDQLKGAISSLINKSLIEIIKMSGMRGVFMGTDQGNEEQLRKRLEMVNWGRTFNSLTFLDKDDEYDQREFGGLEGLANLLDTNMILIAAALEMQGILFGDLKGGLNQESDAFRRYSVTIENRCNSYVKPIVHKLLTILYLMNGIEESVDFEFNSLNKKDENNDKIDSLLNLANMLDKLVQGGILTKYQYADTMKGYLSKNILNINFSDEHMNKLKLEEEYDILKTLKASGKTDYSGENIRNEFPSVGNLENRFTSSGGGVTGGESGLENMVPERNENENIYRAESDEDVGDE